MYSISNLMNNDIIKSTIKKQLKSDINIQTNYWIFNKHNITLSYTPTDSIYLNIISNTTFINYDCIIKQTDLEYDISLDKFHTLIKNCFEFKSNYLIDWQFEPNLLNITFSAILDEFCDIEKKIQLREKILYENKFFTIKLNEIELKHQSKINELEKKIYELQNTSIIFAHNPNIFGNFFSYKQNTKIFDFTQVNSEFKWEGNYLDFNKLTCLKKIIMFNSNFKYMKTVNDILIYTDNKNTNNINYHYFNGFTNIFNIAQIYLPSVLELEIKFNDCKCQIPYNLNSLPNLTKLIFDNFENYPLSSFELIKNIPKLTYLIYHICVNITDFANIKNFCENNNIKLEIK